MKNKPLNSLSDMQLKIFNAINNAEDGITRSEILLQIGQPKAYERAMLDHIHTMIVLHGIPIGSSSDRHFKKGYFIIRNEIEQRKAVDTLKSRVDGINNRVAALENLKIKL